MTGPSFVKWKNSLLPSSWKNITRKDQILELYLNTIYFGHGAYGLKEGASHTLARAERFGSFPMCYACRTPQAPAPMTPLTIRKKEHSA
ncbi:MAG: transglycosylase domain-containing protein [Dialister invisus]